MKKIVNLKNVDDKLKPLINYENNTKINIIDFGNIKVKYVIPENLNFKSNNLIPITDMIKKTNCSGPTCSHNNRHLGDVIMTSLSNIILENFGSRNWVDEITRFILRLFLVFSSEMEIIRIVIDILEYSDKRGKWINDVAKFINNDAKQILLGYFGKVEKHGIQLGKCGNLIAGIKLDAEKNIVKLENAEPLMIYTGNPSVLFNDELNEYNFNSIHCIIEMSNYKKLYNYINLCNIKEKVKNILIFNIKNLSVPSKDIYQMLIDYQNQNKEPKKYNVILNSFNNFKNDGWIVPDNIEEWNFLYDYIIPSFIREEFYLSNSDQKNIFFSKGEFKSNDDNEKVKNISNFSNKDKIISTREVNEYLRFKDYDELSLIIQKELENEKK